MPLSEDEHLLKEEAAGSGKLVCFGKASREKKRGGV